MKTVGDKIVGIVVALTLVASLSMAVDVRYRNSGDWFTVYNGVDNVGWNDGFIPGPAENARINWANGTVTLTNGTALVGGVQTGWDESGTLVIGAGGDFSTTMSVVTNDSSIGQNRVGALTVKDGGTALFRSNLWVGYRPTGNGTVNIDGGTITVEGEFAVGTEGTGAVYVNQDGKLYLSGLATNGVDSILPGSRLDIGGNGQVIISGDAEAVVNLYVANGTLLGNGVTNNIDIQVNYGAETNTVLMAKLVVPNLIGYDLGAATNSLNNLGYVMGSLSYTYSPGAISGQVLGQTPEGGSSAPPGSSVDLVVQEPLEPASRVNNQWVGQNGDDWMDPANWSLGVVPEKETQFYKVQVRTEAPLLLTNSLRIAQFDLGEGSAIAAPTTFKLTGGASLITGKASDGSTTWTAFGWNQPAQVTIETNSVLVAEGFMIMGRTGPNGPHNVEVNLDGGSLIGKNWMSFGNKADGVFVTVNIDNGGFLSAQRFWDGVIEAANSTNGVINLLDGTLELNGDKSNYVETVISAGFIVPAPGLPYTLDYNVTTPGKTTLRVTRPGYTAWAQTWGVDIGSETNDFDRDMVDNLMEYALNGNPIDSLDTGVAPVLESDGGVMKYIHLSRADDPNLIYTVQTRDSLTLGDWVDGGTSILGTGTGGDYNTVTNLVTPVKDASFLRLKVDNP